MKKPVQKSLYVDKAMQKAIDSLVKHTGKSVEKVDSSLMKIKVNRYGTLTVHRVIS